MYTSPALLDGYFVIDEDSYTRIMPSHFSRNPNKLLIAPLYLTKHLLLCILCHILQDLPSTKPRHFHAAIPVTQVEDIAHSAGRCLDLDYLQSTLVQCQLGHSYSPISKIWKIKCLLWHKNLSPYKLDRWVYREQRQQRSEGPRVPSAADWPPVSAP